MKIIDPQGEERKIIQEIMANSFKWRGTLIDKIIFLERTIDFYLAKYFCKDDDKGNELIELILATERMIFKNKTLVLKFIIDKYHGEFLVKHPSVHKDLSDIIEDRNILAHYLLDTRPEAVAKFKLDGTISFLKYRNTMEVVDFSVDRLQKLQKKTEKYMSAFRQEVSPE